MHLQTADMRMPKWKARNWDLVGGFGLASLLFFGLVVALPIAVAKTR